jgi:hypothetical protein
LTEEPFIPVLAVTEGDEAAQARTHAVALVEAVAPIVGESLGLPAVAGMANTLVFRELAKLEGFTTGALIQGLGSALANTFAAMTPQELRQFVRGLEEEAAYQFAAKAMHLRVMEPGGEA